MQIKGTESYQHTPVRMAIIKSLQRVNAGEGAEKRALSSMLLVGMQLVEPPQRTVWKFLGKSKNRLLYNPAIAFLCDIQRNPWSKKIEHFSVHCSAFSNNQDMDVT